MKTLLLTSLKGEPNARGFRGLAAGQQSRWQVKSAPASALAKWQEVPDVTIVDVGTTLKPVSLKVILPDLIALQKRGGRRSFVLFSFKRQSVKNKQQAKGNMAAIRQALPNFPNPDRVEVTFAEHGSDLEAVLDVMGDKLDLSGEQEAAAIDKARTSPLDQFKKVLEASNELRGANGKLSAESIAMLYGISLSQLAAWLGRSRQALTKTPDAESLQDELEYFERIARLRIALADDGEFRKWLRMANPQLGGRQPLALIVLKQWQTVADLVDDMLTGQPT